MALHVVGVSVQPPAIFTSHDAVKHAFDAVHFFGV
jgi:hypothetical protein